MKIFYNGLYHYYYKAVGTMFKVKKEATDYENKSLRLPKEIIDQVQQLAEENNTSFNKVVIQCIEYALENMNETND